MSGGSVKRIRTLRRYQRLCDSIKAMHETGVISDENCQTLLDRVHQIYMKWKRELEAERRAAGIKRGRPGVKARTEYVKCKRPACSRQAAEGQAYCDVSCSPLGHMMMGEAG